MKPELFRDRDGCLWIKGKDINGQPVAVKRTSIDRIQQVTLGCIVKCKHDLRPVHLDCKFTDLEDVMFGEISEQEAA